MPLEQVDLKKVAAELIELPDDASRYSFRVEVVRESTDTAPEKVFTTMEYPGMKYKDLVFLEKVFVEDFLGALNEAGFAMAAAMEKKA